ncbi:hypothetical protein B0T20DRAFT_345008 [Sordaria brevicollis]|uniref:Uncharacterized protein n=1 Tax=Sordaria brevicollis TaxID=83679 RepID=A0AAE0PKC0_SORBR|nr:hypothetical protein B0T20DRAFT_345008 [Sordaria brevicollis]
MSSTGSPIKGYLLIFALPTHPSFTTSHSAFNTWYNQIHIPDILSIGASSGFVSATRFHRAGFNPSSPSLSSTASEVTYPKDTKWQYLAMYPLEDVEKGMGEESGLYKVDLEHEMLPAKGNAMEVARWEMGFWEVVGEMAAKGKEGSSQNHELTTTITDTPQQTDTLLIPLDSSDLPGSDIPGAHPSAILDYSRKGWTGPNPVRSTLLKFIGPVPGGDGTGIKTYLAVHEVPSHTVTTVNPELQTVRYKVLEKFGEASA